MPKTPALPERPARNIVITMPGMTIEIPGALVGVVVIAAMVVARIF